MASAPEAKTEPDWREKRDWLRLTRSKGIGPSTFYALIRRYGSANEALDHLQSPDRTAGRISVPSNDQVEHEIELAERLNAQHVLACEKTYPVALKAIADPPPVLCVAGDNSLLNQKTVGIVGARNASAAGLKITSLLARDLGEAGFVIASGLARGVDGAAHKSALTTGTVAVVAGGIDIIYPPEHRDLTLDIARHGAIVSEMPFGFQPRGRDFPRRNRIISGLSQGVVIVEAAQKSGTLITARFALEQGREVFAVPGSPLDPRSHGTNGLIRQGAMLVEKADDIQDALQNMAVNNEHPCTSDLFSLAENVADPAERGNAAWIENPTSDALSTVKALLSYTPTHPDELSRACDVALPEISQALLDLVLSGDVQEQFGGKYVLSG